MKLGRLTNPVVIMTVVANTLAVLAVLCSTESPYIKGTAGLAIFLFTSAILEVNRKATWGYL